MMLLVWICIVVAVCMLVVKLVYRAQHGKCHSKRQLHGQLVIVTGASAGIGLETAKDLARRGARVIMACRDISKAQKVADEIIRCTGNREVEVQHLDTSSLTSVRSFAKNIIASESKIDILVNNAGMGALMQQKFSEDDLDLIMATNHYGPFLLTNMLGKLLKEGAPSRVVCLSSTLHHMVSKLDPDDLNFRRQSYKGMKAYNLSKLCNLLFAKELGSRLKGTGVTSYSVHPGIVNTAIFFKNQPLLGQFVGYLTGIMGKNAAAGAQTSIYCAVDEEAAKETGLYYSDCKVTAPSKIGQHNGFAKKLWLASELDVKLQDNEANI